MKLRKLIEVLQHVDADYGDIEMLVEVEMEYVTSLMPIDEVSIEDRDGYGVSGVFLM